MGASAFSRVRESIARGAFEAVYYLHGDDELRKDELARAVMAAAVDASLRDFNVDVFRGGELDPERVESLLHTPPMLSNRRVVVVRDTGALRKDARAMLERYVMRPSPDAVLILVALAGTKEEKPLAGAGVSVEFAPLHDAALREWIVAHTRAVHGAEISDAAADALVTAAGADSATLASEIDKVVSHANGSRIDLAGVQAVVGLRSDVSLGALLDAVAARDLPVALAQVEPLLGQPRTTAVSIIMALTVQTLAMCWGRLARDRGMPAHQLEREYFGLLKETGAFPMRPWGEAVKAWARHLSRWDRGSLATAIRALQLAEQGAKDTRLSSDEQLLSNLLCAMCAPAARA
jgi:DNA polymerase-3 subunit delta